MYTMKSSGGQVPDPSPAGGALSVTLSRTCSVYASINSCSSPHELLVASLLVNLSVSTLNAMLIILYKSYIS